MKTMMMIAAALTLTTTAMADDKKAPEPKKAPEAKKEEPKKAPEPKYEAPKPPQELTDMAKGMVGTWKCTGKALMDPTKGMQDFTGTNKMSLDLDKFWLKGDMTIAMGPMKMKGTEYLTYDGAQKKWFRIAVDNMGGSETMSSDGFKDNKSSWTGDLRMGGMSAKTKTTVELANAGKELKVSSDMSMDGKKWMTGFEMSCKK